MFVTFERKRQSQARQDENSATPHNSELDEH